MSQCGSKEPSREAQRGHRSCGGPGGSQYGGDLGWAAWGPIRKPPPPPFARLEQVLCGVLGGEGIRPHRSVRLISRDGPFYFQAFVLSTPLSSLNIFPGDFSSWSLSCQFLPRREGRAPEAPHLRGRACAAEEGEPGQPTG